MRRLAGLLALTYALSFLAVCLGGCLSPTPATHGCCQEGDGLRAGGSGEDCCKVVPGVSAKDCVSAAPPFDVLATPRATVLAMTVAHTPMPAPVSAGPPLILRV
jgi:hypothetical protein